MLQGTDDLPARMARLTLMLAQGARITTATIRSKFNVSKATAKRDMAVLEAALPVKVEIGERKQVVIAMPKEQISPLAGLPAPA